MPCGGGPAEFEQELFQAERMLCGLCRRAETLMRGTPGGDILIAPDPTLVAWWRDHKVKDDARMARETADRVRSKIAKRAAAKLTPEERAALGIRDD